MNQFKKIEVNKATLISLKAELLRKQDEVNKAKLDPKNQISNFTPSSIFSEKDEEIEPKKRFEAKKLRDPEEAEALKKSQASLLKKSQLYDTLSRGSIRSENEEHYLVDFSKKNRKRNSDSEDESDIPSASNISDYPDPDEDWIDYVDCLGRTRRCHKSDLEHVKERDKDLKETLGPADKSTYESMKWAKEGEAESSAPLDPFKEKLFQQWEQKEQELLKKDTVHYEDILFNEARAHGVGYYALSGDEAVRAQQQKELQKLHDETEKARAEAAEKRARREEALQKRVRAAKARQRARAGLPPEEESEQANPVTSMLLDFVEEQKKASSEKARLEREAKEIEAQKEREKFVREWDMGKDTTEGHRVLSQEEWVDKKRKERPKDFAPPSYDRGSHDFKTFDKKGFFIDTEGDHYKKPTWQDVRPVADVDPTPSEESKSLYFTTKRKTEEIKKKYYDPSVNTGETFKPTPIRDECDEDRRSGVIEEEKRGAEVAPPLSFEYFGPVNKKRRPVNKLDVEDAIDQGLERLEKKAADKEKKKERYEEFI